MSLQYEQINSKHDLSTICRLCVTHFDPNEMLHIFVNTQDPLEMKITHVIQILVCHGDGLPATVCKLCVEKLNAAYQFITESVATDALLRKVLTLFPETASPDKNVQDITDKSLAILNLICVDKNNMISLCRLCAMKHKSSELTKIFTASDNSYKKKVKRRIYLQLKAGDSLPDSLCNACVGKLDAVHSFVSQSAFNDDFLRNVLYKRKKTRVKREPTLDLDDPSQEAPETKVKILLNIIDLELGTSMTFTRDVLNNRFECGRLSPSLKVSNHEWTF